MSSIVTMRSVSGEIEFFELPETGLGKGTVQVTSVDLPATRCAVADWANDEAWAHCIDGLGSATTPSYQAMLVFRTPAPEPGFAAGLCVALGGLAGLAARARKLPANP